METRGALIVIQRIQRIACSREFLLSLAGGVLLVFLSDRAVLSNHVHLQQVGGAILFPGFFISVLLFPAEIHGGERLIVSTIVINVALYTGLIYAVCRLLARRRKSGPGQAHQAR